MPVESAQTGMNKDIICMNDSGIAAIRGYHPGMFCVAVERKAYLMEGSPSKLCTP